MGGVLLALVLALGPVPAVPLTAAAAPAALSRAQALEHLDRGDVEARRRGAAWLGEAGLMADVPALVRALRDPDPVVRALAERALWQVWSRSGDPEVDRLFGLGVEQMNQRAGEAAIDTFTRIIERQPDFAEGWNKRATVYFLMGDYERSLRDCHEVLKRNPDHFGVLAGYGQIYLQLDQPETALGYFERALAINPNLDSVAQMAAELRALVLKKRRDTI
jgi:tetratricopeptide (TPR) repeat protein